LVLNRYRSKADPWLVPLAQRLSGVSPDTLSWLAFACAVPAGALLWLAGEVSYHLLLLASLLLFLNALLDALDGWVARLAGKASPRGDFLDHVLDRYADIFIVGGIALSAYCGLGIGLLALLGVLMTSYMGTQAQALGLPRNYGGVLGRADRLVLLVIAPVVQWAWQLASGRPELFTVAVWGGHDVTVIEVLMVWFALGGHATAIWRAITSWKELTVRMAPGHGQGEGATGQGGEGTDGGTAAAAGNEEGAEVAAGAGIAPPARDGP
jgi:archaetidylinositol phosphate synthase